MAVDREKITRNAQRLTQRGQFLKAIAEYKKLLSIDPRDIRTRLKLLDLYGRAGKKKEAIEECGEVAESYADQGFYLKAIAVYKQALRIDSENHALYRDMGGMYVKQGLVGDALGAYRKGVEILLRAGQSAEAEGLLVRMEELAPENAAIKVHLGELYIEGGKFDAFEELLGKLISQLRGEGRSRTLLQSVEAFYEKSGHHPVLLQRLAELYVEFGETQKALDIIRDGLAVQPESRDLRLLRLRACLLAEDFESARSVALELSAEDPDDVHILEQLAAIAHACGDREELAGAYKSIAKAYSRKGLHRDEQEYFRKVSELFPDDAEARLALGDVVLEEQQEATVPLPDEGADSFWEEAPSTEPEATTDVEEGLLEIELFLKYGMEEKAADKLRELVETSPDHLGARSRLRDLCQRRGDQEGWVREQLHIARLFLQESRESEALRAYQAILEVDPDNDEARNGTQSLRPGAGVGEASGFTGAAEQDQAVSPGGVVTAVAGLTEDVALREALAEADFYEAQERKGEAAQLLRELRSRYPDSAQVLSRLRRLGVEDEHAVGETEETGDFVDLQQEILDATSLSLGGDFEGFQDFEVSELDDIVKEFKSGIAESLDAEDFDTHYNLGVAYREMGLLDDALEEFRIAARSPDKAREAYSSVAQVYREQGKRVDARTALQLALAVPGSGPEDRVAIWFEIGSLAESDQDWAEALDAFEKTAEIDPNHRDVGRRLERARARMVE